MNADRKVLLVEDEALVAALAVDALEELGYQTIEVTTAKAAREIACGYADLCSRSSTSACPTAAATRSPSSCARCAPACRSSSRPATMVRTSIETLRKQERTAVLSKPYDIAQLQAAIQAIVRA